MNNYEYGFITKCAEYGISKYNTIKLLLIKKAQLSEKDIENVNDFNNNIVLPTKKEFAGKPGIDYNNEAYTKDFVRLNKINYIPSDDYYVTKDAPNNEIYFSDNPLVSPEDNRTRLVHEVTHNQNRDVQNKPHPDPKIPGPFIQNLEHSGVSQKEQAILNRAYKFYNNINAMPNEAMANAEEATTNREYRYKIWSELSKKLGRNATYNEFKDYVSNMSNDDVRNIITQGINGYQIDALHNRAGFIRPIAKNPGVYNNVPNVGNSATDAIMSKIYDNNVRNSYTDEDLNAVRKAWLEVANNSNTESTNRNLA